MHGNESLVTGGRCQGSQMMKITEEGWEKKGSGVGYHREISLKKNRHKKPISSNVKN